jgi:hypothetical protein
MPAKRQPLAARVWGGGCFRTWWPPDSARHRKRAKRRSARRERQHAVTRLQNGEDE